MIEAVLFDFIGTTVSESGNNIIMECFRRSFLAYVPMVDMDVLEKERGREKRSMIQTVLGHHGYPQDLTDRVYRHFESELNRALQGFSEMPGATALFSALKNNRVRIGIGTGLDRAVFEAIRQHIGWKDGLFDYVGIASEIGKGRPHPDMIIDMMKKLDLRDKTKFLKVGDTVADIREGKNAGVVTAVILSGSQDEQDLRAERPDFVMDNLSDLEKLVNNS